MSALLLLSLTLAANPSGPVTGKKVRVTLQRAWVLTTPEVEPGAVSGLGVTFLIEPLKGVAKPEFTMTEARDFTIDKSPYSAVTKSALGETYEAHWSTDDPPTGAPAGSVVLTGRLSGAKVPASGHVRITLKVGFAKKSTEAITIDFELSSVSR